MNFCQKLNHFSTFLLSSSSLFSFKLSRFFILCNYKVNVFIIVLLLFIVSEWFWSFSSTEYHISKKTLSHMMVKNGKRGKKGEICTFFKKWRRKMYFGFYVCNNKILLLSYKAIVNVFMNNFLYIKEIYSIGNDNKISKQILVKPNYSVMVYHH